MIKLLSTFHALKTILQTRPQTQTTGAPSGQAWTPGRKRDRRRREENRFTNYYDRPIIKKPHWVWQIWIYFWIGGIIAGASVIATLAELLGDKDRDRSIIRAGHYISIVGLLISPVLLILDLGRPERFHHMLRILKLRSPLSVGTYILTFMGMVSGANAGRQLVEDGIIPEDSLPGKLALLAGNKATRTLQGVAALGLGSYTGVLLSSTAVPLWASSETILGPLFLSSGFSTGAASISLARALGGAPESELHRLDRIEQVAIISELALLAYGGQKLQPEIRKHVTTGKFGNLMRISMGMGMVIPFLLTLFGPKKGQAARAVNIINALMVLAGGYILRYTVVEAGKESTLAPEAYQALTEGRGRGTPGQQAKRNAK